MDWFNILQLYKKAYFSLDDLYDLFYAAGRRKPFWIWFSQKMIIRHILNLDEVFYPEDLDIGERDE